MGTMTRHWYIHTQHGKGKILFGQYIFLKMQVYTDEYSELKIEIFAKNFSSSKQLIIFTKSSIIDL